MAHNQTRGSHRPPGNPGQKVQRLLIVAVELDLRRHSLLLYEHPDAD
jgi:hypothetical protein